MIDRLIKAWWDRRAKRSQSPPRFGWDGPPQVACWTCAHTHALPRDPRQALASAQGFF